MRLCVFGGDARMLGALKAAEKAGWDTACINGESDAHQAEADAVMLPWPQSFADGKLTGTTLEKEKALALVPRCSCILHGSGVDVWELDMAQRAINPSLDEAFLRENARLTAEGAVFRAMGRQGHALLHAVCVVTGFGRIGQELAARLVALGAFTVVCARNEMQMRRAHEMGAHPVPLVQIASACRQADVVFNTVPAHVLGKAALDKLNSDALVIELASPPYGLNLEMARHMGVSVALEGGVPGRYAPMQAGAALFDALVRAMERPEQEGGDGHG